MNRNDNPKRLFVMLLSILVFSSIAGCINQDKNGNDNAPTRDSLVIGVSELNFGFYPWSKSYDTATMNVNMNIFNTLVEPDQIFRLKPKLATSWNNPNNITWRFYLRENVKFHNDYSFTSEDVNYTIELIKGDNSSGLRDLLASIEKVEIIDEYTVDIITDRPCPTLLNKLVDIPILSKRYQEETSIEWPIGTGPYKLVKYVEDEHVMLERFDDYWGGSLEVKNATFIKIDDEEEMKNAIIAGGIDIADPIIPMYYEEIIECPGVTVERCPHPSVTYLSFDFRENDSVGFKGEKNPLSDVRVRKAIYYAINITNIIDSILNGTDFAEPASQFVSPLIFGYNPNIERLPYDLEKAKELMKEAGFEDGFELVLDCHNDSYNIKQIAENIQTQLSEIIDVKLNFLPLEDFYMKIISRNTSFFMIGWLAATGDGGEIFDYIIRTVDKEAGIGTYNLGYYSNPEVDWIGDNVSHILDPEERLELMQEGFRIAMEDVAWVPLYVPKCTYGIADYVAWSPRPNMVLAVEDMGFK